MDQKLLYDKKWLKLMRRSSWFRFFPFVDFVLAAGSMALGDVGIDSDFDVIVGARTGRLYTARFFCLTWYKLLGWRRTPARTADGFCFNHFVTEAAYRLAPPHQRYWHELYRHLTPVYGSEETIQCFFNTNASWQNGTAGFSSADDRRYRRRAPAATAQLLERVLAGAFGNLVEMVCKRFQQYKIAVSLKRFPPGYKPRLVINDQEVELHLDTSRLETTKNRRYQNML